MPVVSNTSPISNLATIGRLELLREQLGEIIIPPAVRAELLRHPLATASERIEAAITDGWIRIQTLECPIPEHLARLDAEESEALALAIEIAASYVVIDESLARQHATRLNLPHIGILGLLRHAKQTEKIDSLAAEIEKLRVEAHFFVSQPLERRLLSSVGETN